MKSVMKYKLDDHEGFLSVTESNDTFYAIVKKDAPKVESIKQTGKLLLSFEIKQPAYQLIDVSLSYDEALVKFVFEKLQAEKNLYFKELDDTLCVLVFKK